mmetsp:Transcript_47962/g.74912  ORF Transcript_47962/g.74912 Transcript_47962/m.74912 type:complete len:165 (-) Transcript_47962:80-574(-)
MDGQCHQVPKSDDWTYLPVKASETKSSTEDAEDETSPAKEDETSFMICNTRSGPAKLQRIILVQEMRKASRSTEEDKPSLWEIEILGENRRLRFQATNDENADAWVNAINESVERYQQAMKKVVFIGGGAEEATAATSEVVEEAQDEQEAAGSLPVTAEATAKP